MQTKREICTPGAQVKWGNLDTVAELFSLCQKIEMAIHFKYVY